MNAKQNQRRLDITFEDADLLPLLSGEHDRHLQRIEDELDVDIRVVGNEMSVTGSPAATAAAQMALDALWERILTDLPVSPAEVDAALRIATSSVDHRTRDMAMAAFKEPKMKVQTTQKSISPRSPTQSAYLQAMREHELVFGIGPAGTGKTFLAVAQGVAMLSAGKVDRLILSRPAVEAGEELGFLPGDMREKIDPYLRPVFDALHDMLPGDQVVRLLAQGDIEVAPLAFMRGRTLSNAFVILDEAQNTTPMQMKMILTRLGENSRMVINGDVTQTDLRQSSESGLQQARRILSDIDHITFIQFTAEDVVRHPLVAKIIKAYDQNNDTA